MSSSKVRASKNKIRRSFSEKDKTESDADNTRPEFIETKQSLFSDLVRSSKKVLTKFGVNFKDSKYNQRKAEADSIKLKKSKSALVRVTSSFKQLFRANSDLLGMYFKIYILIEFLKINLHIRLLDHFFLFLIYVNIYILTYLTEFYHYVLIDLV